MFVVTMFVSRFVVRISGNQTNVTITILPPDGRNIGFHI